MLDDALRSTSFPLIFFCHKGFEELPDTVTTSTACKGGVGLAVEKRLKINLFLLVS